MFKLKLGLHLYFKRIGLNFLILINLLVIIFGINSLVLFHNANVKVSQLTKSMENEKIINILSDDATLEYLNTLPGFVKKYNFIKHEIYDRYEKKDITYEARMYDADFMSKFDYKPRHGRWFNEDDVNVNNAVLSYNTKYKVGDTIGMVLMHQNATVVVNVIGILQPNEYLFTSGAYYGGTWEGNFKKREQEMPIKFYCDYSYAETKYESSGWTENDIIRFLQFDNAMSQDEFDNVIKTMKAQLKKNSTIISPAEMATKTLKNQKSTNTLFVPIAVILLLLGLASFVVMSYINIKGCKTEYVVLQSLGAKRKDLLAVLGVTLIIPFVLVTILISTFSSFALLPISYYPNVTTPLNFVVAFSIMAIYLGVNVLFMSSMVLKNKGFKEVINDVE